MSEDPYETIAAKVPGLDLWQPRDWPHRRGDEINLSLHSVPLSEDSPGRRSHDCENCGGGALCIHDNVLCWKCKGTFCLTCTINPAKLTSIPISQLLKNGFAKCHTCQEPLRSIALVDCFRGLLEMAAENDATVGTLDGMPMIGINRNNNNNPISGLAMGGKSLVQEAEDALKRAENLNKEQAILEYTHAINAINYLASSTNGTGLVLRAHDILLIAHCLRAQLEDNQVLVRAITEAYPRASVQDREVNEKTWSLSESGFRSLFYPLPANCMCGSQQGGFLVLDLSRRDPLQVALNSPSFKKQVELVGASLSHYQPMSSTHPHCGSYDPFFERLNGTWFGIYSLLPALSASGIPLPPRPTLLGDRSMKIMDIKQFIRVFPTVREAKDYTRQIYENKRIGEERPPLNAQNNPTLATLLKQTTKGFGSRSLRKAYVLEGKTPMLPELATLSVVVTVENVSTKIFVLVAGQKENGVFLAARAIAYLDRQLKDLASTNASSLKEGHHHPDLTMCAYCGRQSNELKSCSRCKLSKYCSVDCQKKHWEKKGQFGHKMLCKEVARAQK